MTRMRTALVLGGLLAVLAGVAPFTLAARSSRPTPPSVFLSGVLRLLVANRYAEAWTLLDSRDRELAPLSVYVACESASPIPGRLVALRLLDRRRDRLGELLTFSLTIAGSGPGERVRVVVHAHAVSEAGGWRWILPEARRRLYRSGCGLSTSPAL